VALGTPHELARQLGHGQRLEIEVAPAGLPATLDIVQARLGFQVPDQKDGTITVTGAGREAIPGLVAALVGAGVQIYRVTPQEPSLEDVYFALHGEETES
jgi:ABC-2 type transport system ATP-binding protein